MTNPKLTVSDAVSLATVCESAIHGWRVARLVDGNIIEGTARSIGDKCGNFADDDIRDEYLRVTTVSGFEAFWPVRELMGEVSSGYFVAPYAP
jgi:hypothetical protein